MMCGPMKIFQAFQGVEKLKERVLEAAYASFDSWCHCVGETPRDLKEFTPQNLGWELNRDFPEGTWKASDTKLLIGWLLDLLGTLPLKWERPIEMAYDGLQGLDNFLRLCYSNDRLFMKPEQQMAARDSLFQFHEAFSSLALYWYQQGWCLFGFTPKFHYSMHMHDELHLAIASGAPFAWNPGAFATPMMEDMIGQASRISRTTHAGAVPLQTVQKYLVECARLWKQS